MGKQSIVICQAEPGDALEIWHLTHSSGWNWSLERVEREIPGLYVLYHRQRLLGVFHGSLSPRADKKPRIAVHPGYPAKALSAALAFTLMGILACQPFASILRTIGQMHTQEQ